MSSSVNPCRHGHVEGSVSLEEAARLCGLEAKRLLGRIWRDSVRLGDPIGCPQCGDVYVNSLPKRDAERGSEVRS